MNGLCVGLSLLGTIGLLCVNHNRKAPGSKLWVKAVLARTMEVKKDNEARAWSCWFE
jgi:hypothetical protein